jgi:hypothetical protein
MRVAGLSLFERGHFRGQVVLIGVIGECASLLRLDPSAHRPVHTLWLQCSPCGRNRRQLERN